MFELVCEGERLDLYSGPEECYSDLARNIFGGCSESPSHHEIAAN